MGKSVFRSNVMRIRALILGLMSFFIATSLFLLAERCVSLSSGHCHITGDLFLSSPQMWLAFAALFCFLGIRWCWQAIIRKVAVEFEKDGVIFHSLSDQKVAFSNIRTAKLIRARHECYLEFELIDNRVYELKSVQKILRFLRFHRPHKAVLSYLNRKPEEIWDTFENHMNRSH